MKPLISIIVPVYNIMEYLPRCVASLSAQTYQNIEILLVDDGSTDGTSELCDELEKTDSRIRVFHKENGGSSSARNLGLAHCRGSLVGFVDSDDYIEPDMYELLQDAMERYGVSVTQIGRDEIDMEGNKLPDICRPPETELCIGASDFLKELLMHRGDCSFCTKLIKREIFSQAAFPQGVLNEDFHLLIQLLPKMKSIVSLPKQGYHVFCRVGSNTRKVTGFSRVFGDNVDNADMVQQIVEERCPELRDIAFRFGIFQRIDYMLHIPIEQMNGETKQYMKIVDYLRRNWWKGMKNPVLTVKNKVYHTLFAIAPKQVRVLHKKIKENKLKKIVLGITLVISLSAAGMVPSFVRAAEALEESNVSAKQDVSLSSEASEALQRILTERDVMALIYLTDYYSLRGEASETSEAIVQLTGGQQVQIQDVIMTGDGEIWAKVTCIVQGYDYVGYVNRRNLACSDELYLNWEAEYDVASSRFQVLPMSDGDETIYEDIELFPESYQDALYALKEIHPEWVFVKMNTELDWDTVVKEELKGGRSLVYGSNVTAMKEGLYGQNWYYASEEALEYHLDPRNGLTESRVFQFEQLTYNASYHTEAALQSFLDNTFMKGKIPETVMTYAFGITAIGKQYNVSPFHLASRVYQEQGDGTSPLISGTYPGYEGYYNYYNIGATGRTDKEVIENGLAYAKRQDPPWDTPYYALHFGAEQIAANYIARGQDTLYLQKFDVDSSDGQLYWHQYMQNIGAPNSEGASVRKLYESAGALDNTFVFKIPVYKNMPESACEKPTVSNRIVLNILEEYQDMQVYIDGTEAVIEKKNGYYVAEAPDDTAKTAVMYRYDENNIPTGMAVWEIDHDGSGYIVTEVEGLEDLLSYHGFSIRISGRSGLRFKSGISQKTKGLLTGKGIEGYTLKEYGTLMINNGMLGEKDLTLLTENVSVGISYGKDDSGQFINRVLEQVDERDRFASVLVGVPVSQYKTEFAFRSYIILTKDGEETVIYGPQNERSIYGLAQVLLDRGLYPEGSGAFLFLNQLINEADAYVEEAAL